MVDIAIVGAGLSGLVLAEHLKQVASVTIFEKSKGVSGRLATRYTDIFSFDHGSPFFTARTKSFKSFIKDALDSGMISEWVPRVISFEKNKKSYRRDWFEPHYTVTEKMNNWCKSLAIDHVVNLNTRVVTINQLENRWELKGNDLSKLGVFDWVVSAVPAPQAHELFLNKFSEQNYLSQVEMTPCICVMLGISNFDNQVSWDMAKVHNSPIKWISFENCKPGHRKHSSSILIRSSAEWATKHLENDLDWMKNILIEEFSDLTKISIPFDAYADIHRWRYAGIDNLVEPLADKNRKNYLIDESQSLAACGDWLINGDVESAFISAKELGIAIEKLLYSH